MRTALATFTLTLLASQAFGQPKWIGLVPGVPQGTPAQITLNEETSDTQKTVFDVRIFGYWREFVTGPDGVIYQRVEFPGLERFGKVGAPELPVARPRIGVVTDAMMVTLMNVTYLQKIDVENIVVYPQPDPGSDEEFDPNWDPGEGDTKGSDDKFTRDESIYTQAVPWPSVDAISSVPVTSMFDAAFGGDCECYPVQWDPTNKKMTVATLVKYEFHHTGTPKASAALTKNLGKLVNQLHLNAVKVSDYWIVDNTKYHSRYLIVTAPEFEDELAPLTVLKKKQGFKVEFAYLSGGENWLQVLAKVVNWYGNGTPGMEHYCLLVGDTNRIPLPVLIEGIPTDDVYGSPLDLDLSEEVFVGRLSMDGATDLKNQVDKIVAYQTSPVPGGRYDRALLVAHKEGSPDKYQGAHEDVRTATYATQTPTFWTRYGAQWMTNAQVMSDIDQGVGVVCYRGHGSTNTWAGWNQGGESFHKNNVLMLNNGVQPVVWSISCTNNNIGTSGGGSTDCIGEAWLEAVGKGAVASYAATVGTGTTANHELDRRLFRGLYHFGMTTHAHTICYAESQMVSAYPETNNAWAYNLLGDPSMKIRTTVPFSLNASLPAKIVVQAGSASEMSIKALSPDGAPLAGHLVSAWKPGADGQPDEMFDNGYTDSHGDVLLPVSALTNGVLYVTLQDEFGNAVEYEVDVEIQCGNQATNETYGQGKAGQLGVPVLQALDLPVLGTFSTIEIRDGLPGAIPTLVLGLQKVSLPFDGGALLASPDVLLSVGVPLKANGSLKIGGVIPNDPILCGFPLYHQVLIPDPAAGGYYGVSMTNGLKRVFGSP